VHFVYNAVGAVVFSIGAVIFFSFINPEFGVTPASSTNVSMIHTGYNVLLLLLLFPLGTVIMKIALKMAGKEKAAVVEKCEFAELDESILETPEYALENSVKSVHRLTNSLRESMQTANEILHKRDENKSALFWAGIAEADKANGIIKNFLTRLYNEKISAEEHVFVAVLLLNLTSLQRISNHTKGIVKQLESLKIKSSYPQAVGELIRNLSEKTLLCYNDAVTAFTTRDMAYVERAAQSAEYVQDEREVYKAGHFTRISSGTHDILSDTILMEVVRHMSRIVYHSKRIAETAVGEDN
jgi:phosphate:Na+ symporter